MKIIEAVNTLGSIASITGISLLAFGSMTENIQISEIISYFMASSMFIGVAGFLFYFFCRFIFFIKIKFNVIISSFVALLTFPGLMLAGFYIILFLNDLVKYEFVWVIEQIGK